MSRRQVEDCAQRLQPAEAAAFRALLEASEGLFNHSAQLRLQAWELYRSSTGLPKRPRKGKEAAPPLGVW